MASGLLIPSFGWSQEIQCLYGAYGFNEHQAESVIAAFDADEDGKMSQNELFIGTAELINQNLITPAEHCKNIKALNKLLKQKIEEKGEDLLDLVDSAQDKCFGDGKGPCACAGLRECWTTHIDHRIVLMEVTTIRKVVRFMNAFCALLIIVFIFVCAEVYNGKDGAEQYSNTLPGFMLNVLLFFFGLACFLIELRCECCGIDAHFARYWTILYLAKSRATFISLAGIMMIGLGALGGVIGMLLLFPYGIISRHIIATHPLCGDVFITTDPEYWLSKGEQIAPQDKFIMDAAIRSCMDLTPFGDFARLGLGLG